MPSCVLVLSAAPQPPDSEQDGPVSGDDDGVFVMRRRLMVACLCFPAVLCDVLVTPAGREDAKRGQRIAHPESKRQSPAARASLTASEYSPAVMGRPISALPTAWKQGRYWSIRFT